MGVHTIPHWSKYIWTEKKPSPLPSPPRSALSSPRASTPPLNPKASYARYLRITVDLVSKLSYHHHQVVIANIEAREKISEALVSIIWQVGRYEIVAVQFANCDRVQSAISLQFAHILHYLANAISHYKKRGLARWLRVAFGWPQRKFGLILLEIKEQALVVDRETKAASEASQSMKHAPLCLKLPAHLL